MPMPPMSNLSGYSAMGTGPTNRKPAAKPKAPARQKGPLEQAAYSLVVNAAKSGTSPADVLTDFLKQNPPEKATDAADFKYALLSIVAYAQESKAISIDEYRSFEAEIASADTKTAAQKACSLLGASMGMSMTTKILIGVGVIGVAGIGFYAYNNKKSKSRRSY